jgi:xanthine dehydrogenase accessory factor
MALTVFLRGGGDLASGVALRLHRCGLRLVIAELPQPLAVRRLVSFSEAVYTGQWAVEGVDARLAGDLREALSFLEQETISVLVDPGGAALPALRAVHPGPVVLVDARMTKSSPESGREAADLVIGLGPGFIAGENCHAAIETNRGHTLGRVIWQGAPQADTGQPESLPSGKGVLLAPAGRVLRAPVAGILLAQVEIGEHLQSGQPVAEVAGVPVYAPFKGVLRGLIHPGLAVVPGMKIGDVDPRDDPRSCQTVSDKSLAIGGGVLEAILSRPVLRDRLWDTQR